MLKRSPLIVISCIVFFCLLFISFCHAMPPLNPASFPAAPDYAQKKSWLTRPLKTIHPVDVFFVYPTVLFNDSDWLMDLSDAKSLEAAGKQNAAPTLLPGAVAVNPLSWSTNGKFIPDTFNRGAVFFDQENKPVRYAHFTSAQIVKGGLIVQPKNVELVTVKNGHFPSGVYHAFDYSLFYENLRVNIGERIDHFMNRKRASNR